MTIRRSNLSTKVSTGVKFSQNLFSQYCQATKKRFQEWVEEQEKRTYMAAKRSGGQQAMGEETKGRHEGDPS